MSDFTKKHIEDYTKAMLPILKAIVATQDMNRRMLIIAEYGKISGVLNELMAGITFSQDKAECEMAIRLVEEGLADMMASDDTFDFKGFSNGDGGIPSA